MDATMDGSNDVLSWQRNLPFGEVCTDVGLFISEGEYTFTALGYTGQRNYAYINLLDYGASWYSPSLGRFTQPDSIVPDLTDTQSWNRYAYVENNPIRYNDPTGHMFNEADLDAGIYSDLSEEGEDPEPDDEVTGSNPFKYPTLTVSVHNFTKAILGVEGDINININWAALKTLDFKNVGWSVSISGSESVGLSAQEGFFLSLTGSNTPIGDFSSITTFVGERSWNATICLPSGQCGGIAPTTENFEKTSSTSIVGVGEGFDFGVDIISGEAELFSMHPVDGPTILPIVNTFNSWATETLNTISDWLNN